MVESHQQYHDRYRMIMDIYQANEKLNWIPKYDLNGLIEDMINSDIELFEKNKYLLEGGHSILNMHE